MRRRIKDEVGIASWDLWDAGARIAIERLEAALDAAEEKFTAGRTLAGVAPTTEQSTPYCANSTCGHHFDRKCHLLSVCGDKFEIRRT